MEITALVSCLLSVLPVWAYLSMQRYSSCNANAITGDKARWFTGTATAHPCSMRVSGGFHLMRYVSHHQCWYSRLTFEIWWEDVGPGQNDSKDQRGMLRKCANINSPHHLLSPTPFLSSFPLQSPVSLSGKLGDFSGCTYSLARNSASITLQTTTTSAIPPLWVLRA